MAVSRIGTASQHWLSLAHGMWMIIRYPDQAYKVQEDPSLFIVPIKEMHLKFTKRS